MQSYELLRFRAHFTTGYIIVCKYLDTLRTLFFYISEELVQPGAHDVEVRVGAVSFQALVDQCQTLAVTLQCRQTRYAVSANISSYTHDVTDNGYGS